MEQQTEIYREWMKATMEQLPTPRDGAPTVLATSISDYSDGATYPTTLYARVQSNPANAVPKQMEARETVSEKCAPDLPKGAGPQYSKTGPLTKDSRYIKAKCRFCHKTGHLESVCMKA